MSENTLNWRKNNNNTPYAKSSWVKDDGDLLNVSELSEQEDDDLGIIDSVFVADFYIDLMISGRLGA